MHLPAALQDCIQTIVTAAGHSSVTSVLYRLGLYLLIDRLALPHVPTHSCRDTLRSLTWQTAMTRYFAHKSKDSCAVISHANSQVSKYVLLRFMN